jgi:hypothetical protein
MTGPAARRALAGGLVAVCLGVLLAGLDLPAWLLVAATLAFAWFGGALLARWIPRHRGA